MDASRLGQLLGGCVPLVYEEQTGSTNDDAKALALAGRAPVLVVAGSQTAGRGRRGNTFLSPEGGIYMSLAMPAPSESLELFTSFAGVCACEALEETQGLHAGIKWVNDVYVGGRKLAGILVERVGEYAIVGIGVNGSVAPAVGGDVEASCLAEHVRDVDPESLCVEIARRLLEGARGGIDYARTIGECRRRSVLIGEEVLYQVAGEVRRGTAADIAGDGALIVLSSAGAERLTSAACNIRVASDPALRSGARAMRIQSDGTWKRS